MFGDYFCCMQGKYDKRHSKSDLRPEHQKGDYFDALVRSELKFLNPYKDNITLIATGNHESSVLKKNEVDLTARLVDGLNASHRGSTVYKGGYGGYVKFEFIHKGKKQEILLKYRPSNS